MRYGFIWWFFSFMLYTLLAFDNPPSYSKTLTVIIFFLGFIPFYTTSSILYILPNIGLFTKPAHYWTSDTGILFLSINFFTCILCSAFLIESCFKFIQFWEEKRWRILKSEELKYVAVISLLTFPLASYFHQYLLSPVSGYEYFFIVLISIMIFLLGVIIELFRRKKSFYVCLFGTNIPFIFFLIYDIVLGEFSYSAFNVYFKSAYCGILLSIMCGCGGALRYITGGWIFFDHVNHS